MHMADLIHTSRSTRMFYLTKYALVVVLIYVASGSFSKESIEVEVKTISSITFRSDVDIKIEFIGETDDKPRAIADCKTSQKTCYLHDQSFVVSYTGDRALLFILNDVEETRGTYSFCDIYQPNNCVKEKINSPLKNSTKNDTVDCKEKINSPLKNSTKNDTVDNNFARPKDCSDNSANTSGWIAGITIPLCLLCLLCGAIFYIVKLKRVIRGLGCSSKNDLEDDENFHSVLPEEWLQLLLEKDGDFLIGARFKPITGEKDKYLAVKFRGHVSKLTLNRTKKGWAVEGHAFDKISGLKNSTLHTGYVLRNLIQREPWNLNVDDIALICQTGLDDDLNAIWLGMNKKTEDTVVVKACTNINKLQMQMTELRGEVRKFKFFNHENIVKFIGIGFLNQTVYIVHEYLSDGCLSDFFLKRVKITPMLAAKMCLDVAKGMVYLAEKGIHRTPTAKNCMLGGNEIVKINVLKNDHFSENDTLVTQSVFSYGNLMWEICTHGSKPDPGLDDNQRLKKIIKENQWQNNRYVPEMLNDLMLRCWRLNFVLTFSEICTELENIIRQEMTHRLAPSSESGDRDAPLDLQVSPGPSN